MADKKIKIHIGSSADLRAMKSVSTQAALMAKDVNAANFELRQAILKTAADYDSIAAKADKAARGMGTGYKTLEDFLRDIKRDAAEADKGLEAVRAKIQAANKAAADAKAARDMKKLGDNASEASGKVGGLAGAVRQLTEGTGFLGKTLTNLAKGGLWEMGAAGVRMLFGLIKQGITDQIENAKSLKEAAEKNTKALTAALEKYSSGIADAAKAERDAIDASLSARNNELDVTERLTKATIELARQKRIAAGEDAAAVNAETDAKLGAASDEADRQRSDARINATRRKIESAENQRDDAWAEVERLRGALAVHDEQMDYAETPEEKKRSAAFRKSIGDAIAREKATAFAAEDRIAKEQKVLENELVGRDALETEIAARNERRSNDRAAAEKEAAQKAAAAEQSAALAAAKERDLLDRELHAKRMADLRAEIAAQKEAASPFQAVAATAATEFERAFAMYRDPSRAAAEIGEEKDRAEDLERLHRDASRYGGKWRIDELSRLMAAGDSQGVDSRLAEWRKSRSFSPEVEAMVRASAAEQTKTTAEDELRKLNDKTGELAQKIEQLAQSRDGKLDGIERNTSQLANKIDELLTVKG